jgi:hypothetical protein
MRNPAGKDGVFVVSAFSPIRPLLLTADGS